ncbi:MAG: IclR family transcriptional regulator [Anaerolineales bacterium]|jgi:IclR family pca regulon transcriptional regulator
MAENQYTLSTLLRGLSILSLFSQNTPTLSLTEIATATAINKTSAFRVVNTLEKAGYLVRDAETKRYRPGIRVLQLGFAALANLELRQTARPFLERLSQAVGETVSLSVLDGMELIYIDRVRNRQIVGVVLGLGSRLPAHCASMGKAMLAHLPLEELDLRLSQSPLKACTSNSIIDREAFLAELEKVRRQGFATNDEELEMGLRAVAAPVWDRSGQVVAAVNITGSAAMISCQRLLDDLAPAVTQTAKEISRALGYAIQGG